MPGLGGRATAGSRAGTTTLRGTYGAESIVLAENGSPSAWSTKAGPNSTSPRMARAYGSSSSFRVAAQPAGGVVRPAHAEPVGLP